jgi:hypothetical protein
MIALLACSFLFGAPDLLAESRYIFSPTKWAESQATVGSYTWLDPNHLLFYTASVSNGSDWTSTYYSLDVTSLKVSRQDALTAASKKLGLEKLPEPDPSGKRLLWSAYKDKAASFVLTGTNGEVISTWRRHAFQTQMDSEQEESSAHWSADGRSITESQLHWDEPERISVWSGALSDLAKEGSSTEYTPWTWLGKSAWCDAYELGDARMLAIPHDMALPVPETVPIVTWSLENPGHMQTTLFHVPPPYFVEWKEVSPDRKRLLWILWSETLDVEGIWTSRIDGSDLREVGTINFLPKRPDWDSQHFGEIHWVPGSKSISYIFMGKLYLVDAP